MSIFASLAKSLAKRRAIESATPAADLLTDLDMHSLDAELATDAVKVLGYSAGAASIHNDTLRKQLLRALADCNINVLDYSAVSKYMIRTNSSDYHWEGVAIRNYAKPIPSHILQDAISIKKALPAAEFRVWERRHIADPFLSVSVGNVEFFIAVWDEAKF